MDPVYVRRDDLHLGYTISALTAAPDGRRLYVGRGLSDDQARENLAVLAVEEATGTVLSRRLLRDGDAPLPLAYQAPNGARPRSTVAALVASATYRKLYVAATLEDLGARPRRLLSVYDLDRDGDPVEGSLRTYRADVDSFTGGVAIDGLALDETTGTLYMAGGKWVSVRWYRLDPTGEPLTDQPGVLVLPGNPAVVSPVVGAGGSRLYVGRAPGMLQVLRLDDGVPTLTGMQTLTGADPGLALGGDGYLRMVGTPRALFAVRSLQTLTASTARARPVPLYALPLDDQGDPAAADWQRLDGYDHVVLAADPVHGRLWLAEETASAAGVPDGVRLAGYELGPDGLPGALVEKHSTRYGEQPVLAAVAGTGAPALLVRPVGPAVDHAAGEQLRFRVSRVAGTGPPVTFSGTVASLYGGPAQPLTVAEGELSDPVPLDAWLTGQLEQVPIRLRFLPAVVPGVEYAVEAHWTPAGAPAGEPLVRTTVVQGQFAVFLLPGYALLPPADRAGHFVSFAELYRDWRKVAEAVALAPDERPDRFVVSAYSISGAQGSREQLDDGLAVLRALGVNSVQVLSWPGLPAAELADAAAGFSPEAASYAVPAGLPFAFAFDGSLTHETTGVPLDADFLRTWAEQQAAAVRPGAGVSPGRVVRFQLADEPGWYFPGVLRMLDPADPQVPVAGYRWTDGQQRNAAWLRRFRDYVTARDPSLGPEVVPTGASGATTPEGRRRYYWTTRFLVDEATDGVARVHDALQTAFGAEHAPDPRPEHDRLHVHLNFGETLDWQWHKPYPNAPGDKNPDTGPDAATGGYDWFRLGAGGHVLPSKHTYTDDATAQSWSFYADLLRSATRSPGGFTAFVPGSSLGDLAAGAAYKIASVLSRGAKMVAAYAFGPEFLFVPPNSWGRNLAAYGPLADAFRLVGRTQDVLYPGVPEAGRVAIQLPVGSRLWDPQQAAPAYAREVRALHAALTHDGWTVDLVDDSSRLDGYRVLYLLGPNLGRRAQQRVAAWVHAGGTLVVLPGAAIADEADEPASAVGELLGVTRAGWAPLRQPALFGPTVGLSRTLEVADPDWRAALGTGQRPLRDLVLSTPTGIKLAELPAYGPAGAQVVATTGGQPAITRRAVGAGIAYTYAFFPGWQYWCTATHPLRVKGRDYLHTDRLPRYWDGRDRLLATLPVRLAGVPRSVTVDTPAVEVRRLDSAAGIAVVLLNWTGAPVESVEVTVEGVGEHRRARSARRGPLPNLLSDADAAVVRLPLPDVDILVLER